MTMIRLCFISVVVLCSAAPITDIDTLKEQLEALQLTPRVSKINCEKLSATSSHAVGTQNFYNTIRTPLPSGHASHQMYHPVPIYPEQNPSTLDKLRAAIKTVTSIPILSKKQCEEFLAKMPTTRASNFVSKAYHSMPECDSTEWNAALAHTDPNCQALLGNAISSGSHLPPSQYCPCYKQIPTAKVLNLKCRAGSHYVGTVASDFLDCKKWDKVNPV